MIAILLNPETDHGTPGPENPLTDVGDVSFYVVVESEGLTFEYVSKVLGNRVLFSYSYKSAVECTYSYALEVAAKVVALGKKPFIIAKEESSD